MNHLQPPVDRCSSRHSTVRPQLRFPLPVIVTTGLVAENAAQGTGAGWTWLRVPPPVLVT